MAAIKTVIPSIKTVITKIKTDFSVLSQPDPEDNTIPPITMGTGSVKFTQLSQSYIEYENGEWFQFSASDDFTIEWFQWAQDYNNAPRVFSVGAYPSAALGVSIEGGSFYFWANGSYATSFSTDSINKWKHFAIVKNGSTVTIYENGISQATCVVDYDITSSESIYIGAEQGLQNFSGYISNFRLVKGFALYTENFEAPTQTLSEVTGTQLLLNMISEETMATDSSVFNRIPIATYGLEWRHSIAETLG